jgi:hypothetical protein
MLKGFCCSPLVFAIVSCGDAACLLVRVERTLLSAAFDPGVGLDFRINLKINIKINFNVKGSGQECPLHKVPTLTKNGKTGHLYGP